MSSLNVDEVHLGDCLEVMRDLDTESIDLIYLDPPFFTQKKHTLKNKDGSKTYEFSDSWSSLDDYLDFMRARLVEMRRVLRSSGSLFLHCDTSASHHLRVLLDDVFGNLNFRSEIIWTYKRWSNSSRALLPTHQTIFLYSKTDKYKFNTIFGSYSESTNVDQILQLRQRDESSKTKYLTDEEGNVVFGSDKAGVPLGDTWDIPFLNPKAKERVGYPTQKPLLLLERVLQIASDPGDLVLDPFCGSGTTLVASHLLDRHFIGIDQSQDAVKLAKARLANPVMTQSDLMTKGRDSYREADLGALSHLRGLDYVEVHRNKGIDAFLRGLAEDGLVPVRVQREHETLLECVNNLLKASRDKGISVGVVVRTNPDTTLPIEGELPESIRVVDSVAMQLNQQKR